MAGLAGRANGGPGRKMRSAAMRSPFLARRGGHWAADWEARPAGFRLPRSVAEETAGDPSLLVRCRHHVQKYLWDSERGLFFDYNFEKQTRSTYEYVTTFYPLWAGIATPEQERAVMQHVGKFEQPGGLVMSPSKPADSGIFRMRGHQTLPGTHSPSNPVAQLAGLVVTVNGKRIPWMRDRVDMHAFHVEAPQGATTLDLDFQYLASLDPKAKSDFVEVRRRYVEQRAALSRGVLFARYQIRNIPASA